MRFSLVATALFASMVLSPSALAWWDEGHMQIAYLAYQRLSPTAKFAVDRLLKLNPDYCNWIHDGQQQGDSDLQAVIFMRASTWADDIKPSSHKPTKFVYTYDDVAYAQPGTSAQAYKDLHAHAFWHYRDSSFSTDGMAGRDPDPVNLQTQLDAFITDIKQGSGQTQEVRSYELTWMVHMVGDAHQPLHAVSRLSKTLTEGDQGGNFENVMPASGTPMKLHAYWDAVFGSYATTAKVVQDVRDSKLSEVPVIDANAKDLNPIHWLEDSFEAAKEYAYAEPVRSVEPVDDKSAPPVTLNSNYEIKALEIARAQAALAAARLANVLNQNLAGDEPKIEVNCGN